MLTQIEQLLDLVDPADRGEIEAALLEHPAVLEAAVLAGAGGLLGVVGGIAVTGLLSVVLTAVLAPWRFVVEPWAVKILRGQCSLRISNHRTCVSGN